MQKSLLSKLKISLTLLTLLAQSKLRDIVGKYDLDTL